MDLSDCSRRNPRVFNIWVIRIEFAFTTFSNNVIPCSLLKIFLCTSTVLERYKTANNLIHLSTFSYDKLPNIAPPIPPVSHCA